MRAVDGFAADHQVFCAEARSAFSRLMGIQSRLEANWPPTAETSDANAIHGEIASGATSRQVVKARGAAKSHVGEDRNRGWAVDLEPMRPLFYDVELLNPRAGRVAENELIALNNQGANSRRVA